MKIQPMSMYLEVPPKPGGDDEWAAVEGLDPQTVQLKRAYEAEVEHKVSVDHAHVIWAYGLIWAMFAVYGAILWRRSMKIERDVENLRKQLRDG